MTPYTKEANDLFLQGTIALAKMQSEGMRINEPYLERTIRRATKQINSLKEELYETEVFSIWRKRFGNKANLGSNDQLGKILYEEMGYTPTKQTEKGQNATDKEALGYIDHPFIPKYLELGKMEQMLKNNFLGIKQEIVNSKVHAFFSLGGGAREDAGEDSKGGARSGRGSSSSVNLQNIPIRDKIIGPIVRKMFIPSEDRQLVEVDYSGAEVKVSASYNLDPVLIEYLLDPENKDMHRDMAMQLFMLPYSEFKNPDGSDTKTGKDLRYLAKNAFVFAQFYGSYWFDCARNIWNAAINYKTSEGITLRQHLINKGFRELGDQIKNQEPRPGTYEAHVQKVEKDMWGNRFKIFAQWKKDEWELYKKNTYVVSHTGFVCSGYMTRKQVLNYPTQGSSFHCLLWSLIQIQNEMSKRGMKSKLISQVHDSIIADVVPEELGDYLGLCKRVMTIDVQKHWPWLVVPMAIEADVCPVNGSWAEKKGYKI